MVNKIFKTGTLLYDDEKEWSLIISVEKKSKWLFLYCL